MTSRRAHTRSLRARLMRMQWLALLLTGAICAVLTFALTWRTVNDQRDHTLEQVAQSVIRHGLESEDSNEPDPPDKGQFTSQIWTEDGVLSYPAEGDDGPPRQQAGWHRIPWQSQTWHVFTLVQDGLTIQVSQPDQSRSQALWQLAPWLLLILVTVTAGLYGLLHLAADWSLRPLGQLREQLNDSDPLREHDQLTQQAWPEDMLPLVNTLHTLFARLSEARAAQQHLVARTAHEFRTPLAALKIHAQLLGRAQNPGHDERHRAHLLQAIDRMTRLVDQLLKLAECEALPEQAIPEWFEVVPWLVPTRQDWHTLAAERHMPLRVQVPEGARLLGHASSLKSMLDNVVHNAIAHSGSAKGIEVTLDIGPHTCTWRVVDHGQGMSQVQRAQVGQGFVSRPGAHSEGSGLGLAIACKVATLHRGSLCLEDTPGGGLTVCITLPARESAPAPGLQGLQHQAGHQQVGARGAVEVV